MRNFEEQEALRKKILSRLKRIEGQVRGIQKMIEAGKECEDILVQVRAVRSALAAASGLILRRYLSRCHEEALAAGRDTPESLEKFIRVMANFMDH
ncbi:MAG: metal-sensitive transcriptional regulator [Thermodesulfobacteriota bacterium]|nr:metal-sensitive transcriptional regulator [Desulfovibrio sp.]